ncbi:MAG: ATPase [Hyphomicrobiales bacterium]|nr:MAG: ATPase [Hyphomicrobiales bacterium]
MSGDDLRERIQAQLKPQLPKRFYRQAAARPLPESAFGVVLDERPLRTPGKAPLALPAAALAAALAEEWEQQAKVINPAVMPLTRLANTAIDRIAPDPAPALAEIMPYAGADLTCYRADGPASLTARQSALWDPHLKRISDRLGAQFITTQGIGHVAQPEQTIAAVAAWLEERDAFSLAAIHTLTSLTGSVVLAFAVADGGAETEPIYTAAHVDELWQISQWGEDEEAGARLAARRDEIAAACRFLDLLDT